MSTALDARPEPGAPPPVEAESRAAMAARKWVWTAIIIAIWVVLYKFFEGRDTLALPGREHTDLHEDLAGFRDSVLAGRDTNPVIQFTYALGDWFTSVFDWLSPDGRRTGLPAALPADRLAGRARHRHLGRAMPSPAGGSHC